MGQLDVFAADTKVKSVPVKCGDRFEDRPLRCISSQMKQGMATRVQEAIRALAAKKKKATEQGKKIKIGKLKFKRSIRSIPLKQHGNTYSFTNNGNRLKIQCLKDSLRVRGFDQIPVGAELANAVLLKRANGYYLKVTVYTDKNGNGKPKPPARSIGIDTGIKHQFAFSDGVIVDYSVPTSQCRKLRRLSRRFSRTKPGSKNRSKALARLQKKFEHLTNCKRDIINKLVAFLTREYQVVCFQKENLSAWQHLYGKKMLDTALGSFLTAVKERSVLPSEVDRFFPSTQLCSNPGCNYKAKKELSERMHTCPLCGLVLDRDVNAAINLEQEGLKLLKLSNLLLDYCQLDKLGTERCQSHACGDLSSTLSQRMVNFYNTIPRVRARQVVEPGSSLRSFCKKSESWG
ncbi:MAG: RNA-guided endonuclease InsQ/TnpB family protein [Candidatus Hodarchaeales archaeon]